MAATLVEGQKYGLDSNDSTSGNKTFIHFKLTDSALRALEEFSKIKVGCNRKPSIQFTSSAGVMRIPGQVSSDDPKAERTYHLNLAKIHGDANGSFDCVQQSRTRHGSGLQCMGSIQYKVNTHANNDVYSDTRKKIALADVDAKKFCAKEIKFSGRFSGKKIKKVIPSSQFKALNPARPTSLPSAPRPSSSLPSSSSSSGAPQSSASSRLTPSPSSAHSPVSDSRPPVAKPSSMISSTNGILKIGNSSGNKPSRAVGLPYRDRVIHLLALRPYKKPELVYRLMKDGIHEKDRDTLGAVLKSVSVLNKDNTYSLAKHAWQHVRSDWPLYSDTDRTTAKKNQQQVESRSSVSPTVSPALQSSNSPSPPQKRASEECNDVIPSKKQRISHIDKRQSGQPNGKLPNGTHPSADKTNGKLLNGMHPSSDKINGKHPNGMHPSVDKINGKHPNGMHPLTDKINGKLPNEMHPTTDKINGKVPNGMHPTTDRIKGKHPNGMHPTTDRLNGKHLNGMHTSKDRVNGKLPNGTRPLAEKKLLNGTLPSADSSSPSHDGHKTSAESRCNGSRSMESSPLSMDGLSDKPSPIPESPSSNCENQGKGDEQDSSSPDYLILYNQIEDCDQRHRYKEDFNKEYAEYRHLHEKVQNVSRRFEHLKERISNTKEGSQVYEELRNMVLKEYKEQKSNPQFLRHKQRVNYLHNKLAHIKQLILHYDRHCHLQHCS